MCVCVYLLLVPDDDGNINNNNNKCRKNEFFDSLTEP